MKKSISCILIIFAQNLQSAEQSDADFESLRRLVTESNSANASTDELRHNTNKIANIVQTEVEALQRRDREVIIASQTAQRQNEMEIARIRQKTEELNKD